MKQPAFKSTRRVGKHLGVCDSHPVTEERIPDVWRGVDSGGRATGGDGPPSSRIGGKKMKLGVKPNTVTSHLSVGVSLEVSDHESIDTHIAILSETIHPWLLLKSIPFCNCGSPTSMNKEVLDLISQPTHNPVSRHSVVDLG